ncbi:MAG: hypothetical protein H0X37_05280 [Herpetosiphonaceae bacterium]|nr:hypothetical protein [Herpetosiphonaceae bacterium]
MLLLYQVWGKELKYWASRYLQKVRKDGGLQAAKEWLARKGPTDGLQRLAKEHRLDLAMEALVLKEPWRELFSEDELRIASERLENMGT